MNATTSTISFQLSSGGLCFGKINDFRCFGSLQPSVQTPQQCCRTSAEGGSIRDNNSNTVLRNTLIDFTITALNGRWYVYPLVAGSEHHNDSTPAPAAWFVSHESIIEPYEEAKWILQVANSPYEADSGTNESTNKTWDGRVLVINRSDWSGYNDNNDQVEREIEEMLLENNTICLVDYQHAKTTTHEMIYI